MGTIEQVETLTSFLDWRSRTNDVIDLINLNKVGSPTLMQTVRDFTNYVESAGVFSGCTVTDNLDGTIAITTGEALMRANSNVGSELFSVLIIADSVVGLSDNEVNYIYVDYNSGSPIFGNTLNSSSIDSHSKCLIAIISREGNDLTILQATSEMSDQHNKLSNMLVETKSFNHVLGGTVVSETGTKKLSITAGSFYRSLKKINHPVFDTSDTDIFKYHYRNGTGGWNEVGSQTTINVLKYDNNSGNLEDITVGKYACQWIYLKLETSNPELYVFYGQGEYDTIAEARRENKITGLPNAIAEIGVLIGRTIFKQNNPSLNIIESILDDNELLNHLLDTNNPHSVTPEQIGADPEGSAIAMAIALG